MTPSNFGWFLHAMLFYHTQYVVTQKKMKKDEEGEPEDEGSEEEA